jgi:DNA-binding CsgD family transcriptional regulator
MEKEQFLERVGLLRAAGKSIRAIALEPEQARFRLFDSITTFLKHASQSQPLMLILDDLHWADKPSLLLLEFLARQLVGSHLLVLGCYRDTELSRQHPLSETLAQLTREPGFQRMPLRGLSREEAGRLIQATAGVRPSQGLVETIYASSEGNPFFMTEVIRSLRERGELDPATANGPQSIRIPEGVREVIGQRLNRLSEPCRRTLVTASVIGRDFEFNLLSILCRSVSEDELLAVMDEALTAHLIEELPGRAEGYQFCHALIQETLASELSAARRVRLHARIGEALEELYGANVQANASILAHHFARAMPIIGPEKLVHYSLLAGERALATNAWEDALQHFQRGLDAKQGQLTDSETADLLFGLGRAQLAVFPRQSMPEAMDNLDQAFDAFKRAGDTDQAVAVAEYPLPTGAGILAGAGELLSRALALVPPDSLAAGRLLVRNGWDLGRRKGDYQGAQQAFHQALVIALCQGDTNLEMDALAAAAEVDLFHLCCRESLAKNLRAIDLARQADDFRVLVQAHQRATLAMTIIGDLEGARFHASAALAPAEKLRVGFWLDSAHWGMQFVYRLEGNWLAARKMGESSPTVSMDLRSLADRMLLEYELGDFSRGAAFLQRLLEDHRKIRPAPNTAYLMPAIVIPLAARIDSAVDGVDVAQATAEAILSSISATPLVITGARAGLAILAVWRGDVVRAQEQYTALLSQRGTMLQTGIAAIDRVLGLLAHTTGNLDQAMEHFEDSLAFCRKAGVRPELAWTCHDYTEALLERNGPGDHARALTLLEEALNISRTLEMQPLRQRVTGLRERTESPPSKRPAYPGGLTAREVEVLRLIANGKSNREIASELVVTARTVERHVTNIYRKINARNKADATAYALREGLCHFR